MFNLMCYLSFVYNFFPNVVHIAIYSLTFYLFIKNFRYTENAIFMAWSSDTFHIFHNKEIIEP